MAYDVASVAKNDLSLNFFPKHVELVGLSDGS